MSKENLERFMVEVAESRSLQVVISDEINAESLVALGAKHGFDFSVEDIQHSSELREDELREDELSLVVGGVESRGGQGSMAIAYNPKYGRSMYHFKCNIGLDTPMGMP